MTTIDVLPIDEELASILTANDEDSRERLRLLVEADTRRAVYGLMRAARRVKSEIAEREHMFRVMASEHQRALLPKQQQLEYLEEQIAFFTEPLLADGSKHYDIPMVGRVQYRDLKESIRIEDPEAFMGALGPDETELMVEQRPHLRTNDAKKYQQAVLETEGGQLLPGAALGPAQRVTSITYEGELS